MTVIHMDTEVVTNLAQKMIITSETIDSSGENLKQTVRNLSWDGNSRSEFEIQVFSLNRQLNKLAEEIKTLAQKLRSEIEEWLTEDKGLGDGALFITGRGDLIPIHPSDVDQGALGDCYLMASLGAIAFANPELIRDMITVNPDGSYTVRFYNEKTGKAEYVIVRKEDLKMGIDGNPIYAQYGDDGELWPAIIEKGYAQWIDDRNIRDPWWSRGLEMIGFEGKEDYKLIKGGLPQIAMQQITGKSSVVYHPANNLSEQNLIDLLEQNKSITFGTNSIKSSTDPLYHNDILTEKHAYYITGYDKATGMVEVRNPWGWTHQHGLAYIPLDDLKDSIQFFAAN